MNYVWNSVKDKICTYRIIEFKNLNHTYRCPNPIWHFNYEYAAYQIGILLTDELKYSRMDQVKFVEDSL